MSEQENAPANAERGYTITRVFDAPRALVWQVWTEPDHFAYWFGGTETRMEDLEMDVRPGGEWHGTMVLPDGAKLFWSGRYLEVEPPSRLVIAVADQPTLGDEYETLTVTLTEAGTKTTLVMRQTGHLTDEQYEQAKQGTAGMIDAMAELLATLQ